MSAIIHALRADRKGNVLLEGIVGVQKEAVLAAKRSIVTVEEIVDELNPPSPNSVVLPTLGRNLGGACAGRGLPSYAQGYYARSNAFYIAWDEIARDRDSVPGLDQGEHVMEAEAGRFRQICKNERGVRRHDMTDFTPTEMMTIAAARALTNDDVCFVGIGAPSAACNVARLTHAPDITLIYESGTVGTKPDVLPLSIGDGELL